MMEFSLLFSAFLVGLFGSGHCVVMCGGMASALQMMMGQAKASRLFVLQLSMSLGRVSSYALLGGLFGALGATALIIGPFSHALQLFSGVMLLLMALYVSRLWSILAKLERHGSWLWHKIQPFAKKLLPINTISKAFGYGLCWGYLPCGLVYSGLSVSLSTASFSHGALWMLSFGLGTLPAVLLTGQAAQYYVKLKNTAWVRITAALVLTFFGLQTIYLALRSLVF